MSAIIETGLDEHLPLITTGKIREIYELDKKQSTLVFVATDRISAFDVVMKNGINEKGAVLTQLSAFWFKILQDRLPSLRTHLISLGLPLELKSRISPEMALDLETRSMVVEKLKVLPIESIVRGYITGSAWVSYRKDGTVCGIALPRGLQESQKLEQPLWTPSTKAEVGGKDENISPEDAARLVGHDIAKQIENISIQIYEQASIYAADRGIIIADTKFEFGLDESTSPVSIVLIDEVLTPDSSRFWSADEHKLGRGQASFDKQYLRDWLIETSQKGKEGVTIPAVVVENTIQRYKQAYKILVGKEWESK